MGEVDKCISILDYYNKNAKEFIKDEQIPTRYKEAYVVN